MADKDYLLVSADGIHVQLQFTEVAGGSVPGMSSETTRTLGSSASEF